MLKCAFMVSMSFSKVFIGSPSYCYGFQRNAATKPYYIKNQSTSENVFDICHIANIVSEMYTHSKSNSFFIRKYEFIFHWCTFYANEVNVRTLMYTSNSVGWLWGLKNSQPFLQNFLPDDF